MTPPSTSPGAALSPLDARLWPDAATVDAAGRLRIAGIEAGELARAYGTPLYVYDEATVRAQCRALRRAFAARWPERPGVAVAYAGKAYLARWLVALLGEEGLELDAVSAGELGLARGAGYPAARVHLHGNYKPDAELGEALAAGVGRIVVDSLDELAQLEALAAAARRRVAIWLRLRPDVETATHAAIQTGHAGSKFGLDLPGGAAFEAARRAQASPWLELVGLHAHIGSQLFDGEPFARVSAFLGEVAAGMRDQLGIELAELSPGGGLGVPYHPEDPTADLDAYAEAITGALRAVVARRRLATPRLMIEAGRAIIARAGVALYTSGPRKLTPDGVTLVAVDGGMGDNPRPALYGARYTAALADRFVEPATQVARIVGRYCESGDILVDRVALPPGAAGEIVAIPVSGAYHLPLASAYNLVQRPAVVVVRAGAARLVRRRETLDDLLRLDVE